MATARPTATGSYHEHLQQEKRSAILTAATDLFLRQGYDGTSLAQVAKLANVSTATLFKRFPTKAALFDAIVTQYWELDKQLDVVPQPGDPRAGLTTIGDNYVALLARPEMAALFRIVIAETPRFPDLGERQFALGKAPFFDSVRNYLDAERDAGTLQIADTETAATQFLGMISNFCFWPRLLLIDWDPGIGAMHQAVEEAVQTMLARYA